MFNRILIANRGEVALRIIRACRELHIETVVVYSEADKDAMYLKYADEVVCIGPGPSSESYLDTYRIMSAAEITDVQAIHPGYGFLAERSDFAEMCEAHNIKFIGPSAKSMEQLGDKAMARKLAAANKVPVVPGSDLTVENEQEALDIAHRIGYPVVIKAAAGGGGRGMRFANNDISLINAFFVARSEAEAAFKDPSVYIEKLLEAPRHVEVQILADEYGNIVHLGERDCSLQRRCQKLIEEAPCPVLSPRLRHEICMAAIKIAKAANYVNAGTVEFLATKDGDYYFMEMNTRLQVEHPVTEMVTGVDLVKDQLRIASGERLSLRQRHVRINGAAIECRINAEDPYNGFKPYPGQISEYNPPGGLGVRVDSHVCVGHRIPPYYDSNLGKLIVHQPTRQEAVACMRRALSEFVITGVKTTIPLYMDIFSHAKFESGDVYTTFIDDFLDGE